MLLAKHKAIKTTTSQNSILTSTKAATEADAIRSRQPKNMQKEQILKEIGK